MSTVSPPQSEDINALLDKAFDAFDRGQLTEAWQHFEAALALDPQDFDALNMLGVLTMQKRDWPQAISLFERAIAVAPEEAMAHTNLGLAHLEAGQPAQALRYLDKAVQLAPSVESLYAQGSAQLGLKQWAAAADAFAQVTAMQPGHVAALINQGHALKALQRSEQALACYDQALRLDPARLSAHIGRGDACLNLQRNQEALHAFDRALALQADQPDVLCNRGIALQRLDRLPEAIASYEKALALSPAHPIALTNLSGALRQVHRHEEALQCAERALQLAPEMPEAHANRGNALLDLERVQEACEAMATALNLQPDNPDLQWSLGWTSLLAGDWQRGLSLFEIRWQKPGFSSQPRHFSQPLWLGQGDVRGRTVLLHAEQGLGDTLQFCRYVPMVAALGAQVVLEVQAPLMGLMRSLAGHARLVAAGDPLPAFDLQCPLMSLPLAFQSTPDSVPAPQHYLSADPARIARIGARLGPRNHARIGLVWSGNPAHRNNANRSLPLATLLAGLPVGPHYHCLQRDIQESDMATLRTRPDVTHLPDVLDNFDDTAALLSQMDLVITIDTSLAHLAGAMGKPCWILLSRAPDWRWLLERSDCPWYPSARLFRQPAWGQWTPILQAVRQTLDGWLAKHTAM